MKKKIWIPIIIILLILISYGLIFKADYEKFRFNAINDCEEYYESCTCYGILLTLESYPPQFQCSGLNFCSPIDPPRIECRD